MNVKNGTRSMFLRAVFVVLSLAIIWGVPRVDAQSISTGAVTITSMGCNMVGGTAGFAPAPAGASMEPI